MQATIEFKFRSLEEAAHIKRSIEPDNTPLPEGLTIESSLIGNTLEVMIHCTRGLDSFRATIEDIMSAIDLSVRTSELAD